MSDHGQPKNTEERRVWAVSVQEQCFGLWSAWTHTVQWAVSEVQAQVQVNPVTGTVLHKTWPPASCLPVIYIRLYVYT